MPTTSTLLDVDSKTTAELTDADFKLSDSRKEIFLRMMAVWSTHPSIIVDMLCGRFFSGKQ